MILWLSVTVTNRRTLHSSSLNPPSQYLTNWETDQPKLTLTPHTHQIKPHSIWQLTHRHIHRICLYSISQLTHRHIQLYIEFVFTVSDKLTHALDSFPSTGRWLWCPSSASAPSHQLSCPAWQLSILGAIFCIVLILTIFVIYLSYICNLSSIRKKYKIEDKEEKSKHI